MPADTRPAAYTSSARILHWLLAVLIFGMFALGLAFDSIPRATRLWWINMHTVVGLLLFALVLFRLYWRIGHKPPPLPEGTSDLVRRASTGMHHLLYLLMVVIPIVGIVAYIWHARVFDFGLFKLDFGVPNTRSVYGPAEDIHKYLVFTLIGLVVLHVLAALWHHFIKRDGLLRRMWPAGN
jgi:cytochrome b561